MEKMKIYISLPISGYDLTDRMYTADRIEEDLRHLFPFAEIFNPLSTYNPSEGELEWQVYMARDLHHLYGCTHIYMAKGWKESQGCRLERAISLEENILALPVVLPCQGFVEL